ncbi:MAG TPA: hypothetical protein VE548_12755 [Nitrososphaeraceae archaeon]|jgi:hypothetical protein|nr:hypothetical protein [Nitrososphaeraceae archaeon]
MIFQILLDIIPSKIVADSMPITARDYEICGCSLRLNKLMLTILPYSAIFLFAVRGKLGI